MSRLYPFGDSVSDKDLTFAFWKFKGMTSCRNSWRWFLRIPVDCILRLWFSSTIFSMTLTHKNLEVNSCSSRDKVQADPNRQTIDKAMFCEGLPVISVIFVGNLFLFSFPGFSSITFWSRHLWIKHEFDFCFLLGMCFPLQSSISHTCTLGSFAPSDCPLRMYMLQGVDLQGHFMWHNPVVPANKVQRRPTLQSGPLVESSTRTNFFSEPHDPAPRCKAIFTCRKRIFVPGSTSYRLRVTRKQKTKSRKSKLIKVNLSINLRIRWLSWMKWSRRFFLSRRVEKSPQNPHMCSCSGRPFHPTQWRLLQRLKGFKCQPHAGGRSPLQFPDRYR